MLDRRTETALREIGKVAEQTPQDYAPKSKRDPLLAEREATHGDFRETAAFSQNLKSVIRLAPAWDRLPAGQKESLDLICTKIARVLVGDNMHKDSWDDIAGYSKLGSESCERK